MNRRLSLPQVKTPANPKGWPESPTNPAACAAMMTCRWTAAGERLQRRRLRAALGPPSGSICFVALGSQGDQISQRREAREGLALELPDPLAGQVELVADRLERPGLAFEAEAKLQDAAFPLRKGVECPPDALAPQRLFGLVERISSLAVGEQVAQLALVVRADRLVQRHRGLGCAGGLVDVLNREAGCLRQFVLRRLATELDLEPAGRPRQLLLALDDVHRNANRAGVVRHGALYRLADPPGCIRRELVAAPPVELLDGTVQAERALLDEVQEGDAEAPVALGDGDDQAQVRLDHAPLGDGVASLDCLGEGDLLRGGEQLVAADVGQKELKAVRGPRENVGLRLDRLLLLLCVLLLGFSL